MAKYQIWDKISDIYTPAGEVLTAEQWLSRYAWARIPNVKMIIGGGIINGNMVAEFNDYISMYSKVVDFSSCITDQDYLDAIEAYEDRPVVVDVDESTPEERIAAAMEYQILNDMMKEEVI